MRKRILQSTLLAALGLVPQLSRANDIEPGKEFYNATKIVSAVTLDGQLTEWAGVPVLADPKFAVPKGSAASGNYVLFEEYQGGTWTGPDDQTSAVQVVWDADNVYFGFVVTDDYHENAANSAWNGDSIQLMIANADRNQQIALYNYALAGIEGEFGEVIVMHEAGPGGTDAVVKRDSAAKKTIYEIKLPAASLGLTAPLAAGVKFGLGMAINDGDQDTPGQKGWGGLGAHAIVFGKTPAETALVTLSSDTPGTDRVFFSAVNTAVEVFSFRANSKGTSVVAPATAKLTLDNQVVTLTSKQSGDAYDYTYTPAQYFAPGSKHTYTIEIKDTTGATITSTGTFDTPQYALLTAADKVTPDTTKPGFIFNIHQNGTLIGNDNVRPLQQLSGLLGPNQADPGAQGPAAAAGTRGANADAPIRFEIPGVINLDQDAGASGEITPDDSVPGVPGTGDIGNTDGIAAEIITYVDLAAGKHTFVVNSDDGFRTTTGLKFQDQFQPQVAGEFSGGRGFADTAFTVYVQEAGVYPFRTVWEEGQGGSAMEWKYQKADGTRVLLNDRANGSPAAYRAATLNAPAYVKAVLPGPASASAATPSKVEAVLVDAGTQVNTSSITLKLNGANAPVTATKTAGETRVTHTAALQGASSYTAELTFSDNNGPRTITWNFKTGPLTADIFVIEAEDFDYDGGKTNPQKGTAGLDVDVMPYLGGAYDQLSAQEPIDFVNNDGPDSDQYRTEVGEDGDHEVNITNNLGAAPGNGSGGNPSIGGSDRGVWTMTANYRIGWVEGSSWQNYTRTFPANTKGGWWKVYAALSYDGNTDGQLSGALLKVTSGVGTPDQVTEPVGTFSGPGSGGWGLNNLVPMRNASGGEALVKLSGLNTVRFQLGSGDFDFLVFVPAAAPPPFVEATPLDSVTRANAVLDFTLRDTDTKVNATSIKFSIDGTDYTSKTTSTKTATGATVHVDLAGVTLPAGERTWKITFSDDSTPPQTASPEGKFIVVPFPAEQVFVIEAEDFNYSTDGVTGGKSNPQKGTPGLDVNVMPYDGGAYADLAAVEGIDYNNNDANDSDVYRTEVDENGENEVNITASNGNRFSNDRGAFELTSNYRIGWVEGGSWQNYTRTFPKGDYNVWAALSYDGRSAGQLNGTLDLVTSDPTQPNQVTQRLGSFSAPGSGGWGRNELVPMKDASGNTAVISLEGEKTVRFNLGSGDFDYLLFVPGTQPQPQAGFTSITRAADGSIDVVWTGTATLESAPAVTGPWTAVTGAVSPYKVTPTGAMRFLRLK